VHPCENPALSPLGERVPRDDVFISRREAGLRPPKGYRRSARAARYGPQAGEGVLTSIDYLLVRGFRLPRAGAQEAKSTRLSD
jgi:hypothetical protein